MINGNQLRETIEQVQHDEMLAIETLCSILGGVQSSGDTAALTSVCHVMKDWINCPPSAILDRLKAVEVQLDSHD